MPERALYRCGRALLFALCLLCPVDRVLGGDTAFPEFDSIRPNVEFWTRVFAEWRLGQVVVHDLDHPGVVYEVVDLPGPVEESYTETQREFVEDLNELWRRRLRDAEEKVARGDPLDEAETTWVGKLTAGAGTDALRNAHERVRTQRGLRERFRRGLEISGRYEGLFREIFRDAGLPEDLAYLPHVESSYQSAARSSAGAVGVWQFTRGTGKLYLRIDSAIDERLDPVAAAGGAAAYLKQAHAALGNWPLALTSYNHGLAGMTRAVRKLGNDYEKVLREYDGRLFGFASRNFYAEFQAARAIAREPERYFPEGLALEPPLDQDRVALARAATPDQVAAAFGIPLDRLIPLNAAWTSRAVRSSLSLPRGSAVWLPPGTLAGLADEPPGYEVRRGDTLSAIARAHGIALHRLRELNGIPEEESRILPGQRLRVTQSQYVVRGGDTLLEIALRHGVSLSALLIVNQLSETSIIRPGQRILIPGRG